MKFCNECDNMYYLKLNEDDTNKLIYYCRYCGNEDVFSETEICVLKTNVKKNKKNYSNVINKFTKEDPTLPRVNNINCPNTECKSNTGEKEKDVIYVRYDDSKLLYIYMCTVCENIWETKKK
jgi:DNA-directed RNA polymerase subunit M/transcription elongation factor TFIIS